MSDKIIYCFIRRDIPAVCQIIQAFHAADMMALYRKDTKIEVNSLCLFEVANEVELLKVELELRCMFKGASNYIKSMYQENIDYYIFMEPDWPRGFTSIVTRPMQGKEREFFAKYTLYKSDNDTKEVSEHREAVHIVE